MSSRQLFQPAHPFTCHACHASFKKKSSYMAHLRARHSEVETLLVPFQLPNLSDSLCLCTRYSQICAGHNRVRHHQAQNPTCVALLGALPPLESVSSRFDRRICLALLMTRLFDEKLPNGASSSAAHRDGNKSHLHAPLNKLAPFFVASAITCSLGNLSLASVITRVQER